MKKYNNTELKAILENINNGVVYIGIRNGSGVGRIYKHCHYIRWEYFGSSATPARVDDLKWIIENIFNDCELITPGIYSEYHINYIPIDEKYNGIDFSYTHPNIYGV